MHTAQWSRMMAIHHANASLHHNDIVTDREGTLAVLQYNVIDSARVMFVGHSVASSSLLMLLSSRNLIIFYTFAVY